MKLGIAQVEASQLPEKSLDKAKSMLGKAVEENVELLVFPEMFMAAPRSREEIPRLAEPLTGSFVRNLGLLAREASLYLGAGIWETAPGQNQVFNTFILVNPQGNVQAAYRKLHLFDALSIKESEIMIPGNEVPPLVKIADFATGTAICYDLRFPELFRYLAQKGAQLILVPAAWYSGPCKEEHWITLLQARAIENTVFIAGVGLVGSRFCARSRVIDPYGIVQLSAGEEEGLFSTEISLDRLSRIQNKLPALKHLRPDIFARLQIKN